MMKWLILRSRRLYIPMMLLGLVLVSMLPAEGQQGRFTVVLDAGHGGKDPGAIGFGAKEKEITLGIVLELGRMIKSAHPEVRVLYTRQRDVFVGLQARADFANRHNASLFISVHVNSAPKGSSARGTETYVLGLSKQSSNLSVAMRENKAMLLEDDYKTTYKGFDPTSPESYIMFDLMQEAYLGRSIEFANLVEKQYRRLGRSSRGVRQDAFWVLSQSAMPSVLTEVGFISNANEAAYLDSQGGQADMARALCRAFTTFYASSDKGASTDTAPESAPDEEASADTAEGESQEPTPRKDQPKSTPQGKSLYRVQFMSTPERIDTKSKRFARLKRTVRRTKEGKNYVYTVGETKSLSEARTLRRQVAKHYSDCFVVEYRSGKRIGRVR